MYIYQQKNWPHFIWNQEQIALLVAQLRYQQGCFIGSMESLGFHSRREHALESLTEEILKSSEIESEILNPSLVRSSVAQHLGIEKGALNIVDARIEGMVEMMIDATQHFDQPLTKERIFRWHRSLFPKRTIGRKQLEVGVWRATPVQVISGAIGKEEVHFEGPAAEKVDHEMTLFLEWLENGNQSSSIGELDQVLQAAVAHLWFVTIHPFEDGNGRIGRAIADLLLARSEQLFFRFYSLSKQIQKERKGYYAILEKTQKGDMDITPWLEWFLACLSKAIEEAKVTVNRILYRTKFLESLGEISLNERQKKVLYLLLDEFKGKLTSSKWSKLTKCSQDTAYRDILDLIDKKILVKNPEGGRSASYSLIVH